MPCHRQSGISPLCRAQYNQSHTHTCQYNNGEETEVVEESIELNVDPQLPKVDEMITPEIAQTQPESDEIPAETDKEALVNVESSALIPDAVIETPVLKDVTKTRKKEETT